MAEEGDQQAVLSPAELLEKVESQSKANKFLFIIVLVLSIIVVSVMATGLSLMFSRIDALNEAAEASADDQPVEEQLVALEQKLILLSDFRKSELKKILAYTKQLEKIERVCDLEKSAPYRNFLSSRETDFQALIETIKLGANDLASMSKGSKKWLDNHNVLLKKLHDSSVDRKEKFDSLTSGPK